jgi:hypothetical protein
MNENQLRCLFVKSSEKQTIHTSFKETASTKSHKKVMHNTHGSGNWGQIEEV